MLQSFIHLISYYVMIPTTNKSARVTVNTTTAIDHMITNVKLETDFKAGILKSVMSQHIHK